MAHALQPGMVVRGEGLIVRNDRYVPSEMMGQSVGRGSSGMPGTLPHSQERIVPPSPPPAMKVLKRRRSKAYFVCTVPECKEKFSSSETLETHMKLHQVIKPFTCKTCGKVCRTESSLKVHQARHANDSEKCTCDVCERNFSSRSALKKHKLRIHRPLPHVCPYCHSGFEEERYMAIHIKRSHEKDPSAETSDTETDRLQSSFQTNDFYAEQNVHDGKNYYKNGYVSNSNGSVAVPATPEGNSPFECQKQQKLSGCNTSSSQRKTEVVSPIITCGMCTSTFPSIAYLQQHMAVHVNEKNLTCQLCDMQFTNHQLLSNHLRLHNFEPEPVSYPPNFNNGGYPQYAPLTGQPTVTRGPQVVGKYICALCSEQFLNLGSLKRHQAKGHNSVDLSI